jgi:GH18 family chitinase
MLISSTSCKCLSSLDFYFPVAYNIPRAYDLHGPWEANTLGAIIRPQTSIIDIASALLPLWFDSVPPSKMNLGIAYYGRGFTASNPSCLNIGCPYTGGSLPGPCTTSDGLLSLREIQQIIKQKSLVPQYLPDLMISQVSWDDQWIGYDDDVSIAHKTNWADQHCLGGTTVFSMDFYSGPGR